MKVIPHLLTTLLVIQKIHPNLSNNLEFIPDEIQLDCRFSTDFDWLIIGRVYMCTITTNTTMSSNLTTVTRIVGEHRIFKDNSDIFAVWFLDRKMHFMPSGIAEFFRHLAGLVINRCQLKEIHQADMEPFYKLREFYIIENDIEVLEADLFEFNKRLELLWIEGNKIKRIDATIFDGLEKLRFLNLREKSCTLSKVRYDRDEVVKVVRQMEKKCPVS